MAWPEQQRVFRMIPGLESAEFQRFGAVHRNTFVNAPKFLGRTLECNALPGVYFAGQIAGTEGYVESAGLGLLVAFILLDRLAGREPLLPPPETALGGLLAHLARHPDDYQPSNITFSHLPPWEGSRLKKRMKYEAMAERGLQALSEWAQARSTGANVQAAG
jgi:methylenetetrahydrofolate--tRNA-(uracil-5-)-methyltransferase